MFSGGLNGYISRDAIAGRGKGTSQLEKYVKLAASPSHVSSSR